MDESVETEVVSPAEASAPTEDAQMAGAAQAPTGAADGVEGAEEAPSEEEFEEDLEEEVVDREVLKKQSGSILDKATKKTKKRRTRKQAE